MVKQALRQRYQAAQPNAGALLPQLFPEPPRRQAASSGRVALRALASGIALAAGAVVLLLRIAGPSPATTIWAEDRTVFLVGALAGPRHLFAPYAGYLQLLPRLIAQFVSFLPLPDAAAAFAIIRCGDRGRGGAIRLSRERGSHSVRMAARAARGGGPAASRRAA